MNHSPCRIVILSFFTSLSFEVGYIPTRVAVGSWMDIRFIFMNIYAKLILENLLIV